MGPVVSMCVPPSGERGAVGEQQALVDDGRTCQTWLKDHRRTVCIAPTQDVRANVDSEDPESEETIEWDSGLGNHNYCRNSDSSMEAP